MAADEKSQLGLQLREIQPKFTRFYARILGEMNLTLPQYALLSQLPSSGRVSMTGISAKLFVSKPAVTHLVDRLEKGGFLKRFNHPQDRRVCLIEMQPKGERVVSRVQAGVLGFVLATLEDFSAAEKKTITRFYTALSQIMDQALANPSR